MYQRYDCVMFVLDFKISDPDRRVAIVLQNN